MPLFVPTNELAGISWIKTVPGIPTNKVAKDLPSLEKWEQTGFVQVKAIPTGEPDTWLPMRRAILEISCHAAQPGSNRPPWRKANNLAELIMNATWDHSLLGRVPTPAQYEGVGVHSVIANSEPSSFEGDEARFAKYIFEITVFWTRVPEGSS